MSLKVNISRVGANNSVQNDEQAVLLVGQKNGGTATSGALVKNVLPSTDVSALFGNSQIAAMIRAFNTTVKAIDANNRPKLSVISLDDSGSGVAADGVVAFSGTATAAGTLTVFVGSIRENKYSIGVSVGDTATVVGDALVTAITADVNKVATGVNTTGSVALDAVNTGTEGNNIPVGISGEVAGITVAITGFASGLNNPTLTGLYDPITDLRYQAIVQPSSWGITELKTLLDGRFQINDEVLDGSGFVYQSDSFANLAVLGNLHNSQSIVVESQKKASRAELKGSAQKELDYVVATMVATVRAMRLTSGANIAEIMVADTFGIQAATGGPSTASIPYHETSLPLLEPMDPQDVFTKQEEDLLNDDGVSVVKNNKSRNGIVLDTVVTTYKTDLVGDPDDSYKYQNAVDGDSQSLEYIFNNLKKRYAQSALTDGNIRPGFPMANEASIKGFIIGLKNDLSGDKLTLLREGGDIDKEYKDKLIVTITDLLNGKVSISGINPLISQLRQIDGAFQLNFGTN